MNLSTISLPRKLLFGAAFLLLATLVGWFVAKEAWVPLAGTLGLALLAVWPAYMWLGVFVFFVPFDDVLGLPAGAGGITLTSLIGLVTLFVAFGSSLALRRFRLPLRPSAFWLAFIAWEGCTVLWSVDREAAIERLPTMLSLLAFYLVVASCHFSEKDVSRISRLAILGGCAAAVITLYEFRSGIFYLSTSMRGSLVFGGRQTDPNILAASLLLPLSLAVGELLGSAKLGGKLLLAFCALLITSGIFVTGSRGALLAIAVMLLFYLHKLGMNWRILAPLTLLGGALMFAPAFIFQRLEESQATGGAGRLYIWQTGMAALKDYFLAGAGLDNFPVIYNNYAAHAAQFAGLNRPAHNVFLQIAVESGAIGLLLFVFVIGSHLKYALRRDAVSTGAVRFRLIACEAATCGILVASFFLGLLWTKTFWITWTLLAICSRVPRMDLLPTRRLSQEVPDDFEPSQSSEVLVSSQA
ncbi:MAG: O-antigen ligase family protein [Candidatus Korobacteraceae bacterium]|jgi:O-antigen ligase